MSNEDEDNRQIPNGQYLIPAWKLSAEPELCKLVNRYLGTDYDCSNEDFKQTESKTQRLARQLLDEGYLSLIDNMAPDNWNAKHIMALEDIRNATQSSGMTRVGFDHLCLSDKALELPPPTRYWWNIFKRNILNILGLIILLSQIIDIYDRWFSTAR